MTSIDPKILEQIQTIILDFDMTLADTLPFFLKVMAENLANDSEIEPLISRGKSILASSLTETEFNIKWKLVSMFRQIAQEQTGNSISAWRLAYKIGKECNQRYAEVKPTPGAKEALQKLTQEDCYVILVSLSSKWKIDTFLEVNNVDPQIFKAILSKDNVGKKKIQAFKRIMTLHPAPPESFAAMGDLPGDIIAARHNNIHGIGVLTGPASESLLESARPLAIFNSLKDFTDLY
ncbi:MAG: HAD family hydrolase [Promethearchaeota archaeon]